MVQHTANTGAFCTLYRAGAGSGRAGREASSLDLHTLYTTLQPGQISTDRVAYSPIGSIRQRLQSLHTSIEPLYAGVTLDLRHC